jgi:hypothetical protein
MFANVPCHSYPLACSIARSRAVEVRAFRLATSAGHRARLMLPRGALSGDEFPFTSKEIASLASGGNRERGSKAGRATV